MFSPLCLLFLFWDMRRFFSNLMQSPGNLNADTTSNMGAGVPNVVLLGDSIFDNASYVRGGADVQTHLRTKMSNVLGNGTVTLCAVDGNVASHVLRQAKEIPPNATHLFLSVGGNDALGRLGLLGQRVGDGSIGQSLARLTEEVAHFRNTYRNALNALLDKKLPLTICTIYTPHAWEPASQIPVLNTGLSLFNDVITSEALARGVPVIDLRHVCNEKADFANPIEPSVQGGAKIADAILHVLQTHDFSRPQCALYGRTA
eukprot:GILK01011599.1.p1 GENE.GILK01011599.1~~GILK01011599.1.p1  ORF type:complete len:259 (+),score=19.11 GILK01011599.1:140-916(+)